MIQPKAKPTPASTGSTSSKARRAKVDFPEWVISTLDAQSKRIGVSRQSLIKLWISERIQQEEQSRSALAAA